MTPTFTLATSSVYRQQQFASLGIQATIVAPGIDETPQEGEDARSLAHRLSLEKARVVARQVKQGIIIGADQVAVVGNDDKSRLLGKPGSIDNAVSQLMSCQGKTVRFYSAISVIDAEKNVTHTQSELTSVHFRDLNETQLRAYVKRDMPLDCAGAFKAEKLGVLLFKSIDSRDPNALIGLPIMLLRELLAQLGIDLLSLATSDSY